MKVTIKDPKNNRFYEASLSRHQASRYDNGAMVSCGLTVGENTRFTERSLKTLSQQGRLKEISKDDWNHSSCQSGCTRRGAAKCSW